MATCIRGRALPGLIEALWEVRPCLPPLRRIRGRAPPGLIEARSSAIPLLVGDPVHPGGAPPRPH